MKTEKDKKILDKIRKLLALAEDKGASEGEVENALKMAQTLMMKHQIEEGDVFMSKSDISKELFNVYCPAYENSRWIWDLLIALGKHHNVKIYSTKRADLTAKGRLKFVDCWSLVGFDNDKEILKEISTRMVPVIQNLAKSRVKQAKKEGIVNGSEATVFHNSYLKGFVLGLKDKLHEEKESTLQIESDKIKYELIVVKKTDLIKNWVEENMSVGVSKTRPSKINGDALKSGYQDGKQKNLNRQIGND